MADIDRLVSGMKKEVSVEVVHAVNGDHLSEEGSETVELITILAGSISLDRSDCSDADLHVARETIEIPPGVSRRITVHETPTLLVFIRHRENL